MVVTEKTALLDQENREDEKELFVEKQSDEHLVDKIILLVMSVVCYCLCILLRGNSIFPSIAGIKFCSWIYFNVYALGVLCQLGIFIVVAVILTKQKEKQLPGNEEIKNGFISYTLKNILFLSFIGFFIGLTSVLFGASGGSMNNIMLILIGFDPLVAVATSVVLIEITSFSTLLIFILNGLMIFDYIIFSGIILIITIIIGLILLNCILVKFKRTSFFCFFMAWMYAFSFILMAIAIVNLVKSNKRNLWKFKQYCKA